MQWVEPHTVGDLSWDCCDKCQHCRQFTGGCELLDNNGADILEIDLIAETVNCTEFKPLE